MKNSLLQAGVLGLALATTSAACREDNKNTSAVSVNPYVRFTYITEQVKFLCNEALKPKAIKVDVYKAGGTTPSSTIDLNCFEIAGRGPIESAWEVSKFMYIQEHYPCATTTVFLSDGSISTKVLAHDGSKNTVCTGVFKEKPSTSQTPKSSAD